MKARGESDNGWTTDSEAGAGREGGRPQDKEGAGWEVFTVKDS